MGEDGPNEFLAIERFLITMLPNGGVIDAEQRETIRASKPYDKQAMRSNIVLNMANLIEMITYLDNPDEEIEEDTIVSIDILSVEILAEMQRYAFVLNGGDPKVFVGRVLSGFNWLETNPPMSEGNQAVRYLEEALAYFIQEDEDDVKGYLRALEQINDKRPDLQAWKWVGGQMFPAKKDPLMEDGAPLDYNDFIELVVAPYEQRAQERQDRESADFFGQTTAAAAAQTQERPFIEDILAEGQATGQQIEAKIGGIHVVDSATGAEQMAAATQEPTPGSVAQAWASNAIANIEEEAARRGVPVQEVLDEKILGAWRSDDDLGDKAKLFDTSGVDSSYPEKLQVQIPTQLSGYAGDFPVPNGGTETFAAQPPVHTPNDFAAGDVESIPMGSRFYIVYNHHGRMWIQTQPWASSQERFDLGDVVDVWSDGGLPIGQSKIVEITTSTGVAEVWMKFVYPEEHGTDRYKLDGEDFIRQANGVPSKPGVAAASKPSELEVKQRARLVDQVLDNGIAQERRLNSRGGSMPGSVAEFIDQQVDARREAKKLILSKEPLQDSEYFARRAKLQAEAAAPKQGWIRRNWNKFLDTFFGA